MLGTLRPFNSGQITRFGQTEEQSWSSGDARHAFIQGWESHTCCKLHVLLHVSLCVSLHVTSPPVWHPVGSPYTRGVKLILTRGHISLAVAFKGPNVILGLHKCNYSLTRGKELSSATGQKQGVRPDKTRWRAGLGPQALCLLPVPTPLNTSDKQIFNRASYYACKPTESYGNRLLYPVSRL